MVGAKNKTRADCAAYVRTLAGKSPSCVNKILITLRGIMNLAVDLGEIPANPCRNLKKPKRLEINEFQGVPLVEIRRIELLTF